MTGATDHGRRATFISLAFSAALLIVLYRSIDFGLVLTRLRDVDPIWLIVSVALIVPITWLRALRFYLVAPPGAIAGVVEALRLTLVSSAANVFMPASFGDLIKSYFVTRSGGGSAPVTIAVVAYERLADAFGLISWCVAGWFFVHPTIDGVPDVFWPVLAGLGIVCGVLVSSTRVARSLPALMAWLLRGRLRKVLALAEGWPGMMAMLRGRRRRVVALSVLLWFVHLLQIYMFTVTLGMHISFAVSASLSAIALMAGQVPFAFGGLGARDVALVFLLKDYARPEAAAALGLLIATRNFLPPLAALPIVRPYAAALARDAARTAYGGEVR